jgi:hypothetical protein
MLDASGGYIAINLFLGQMGHGVLAEVATVGCHPRGFVTIKVGFQFSAAGLSCCLSLAS